MRSDAFHGRGVRPPRPPAAFPRLRGASWQFAPDAPLDPTPLALERFCLSPGHATRRQPIVPGPQPCAPPALGPRPPYAGGLGGQRSSSGLPSQARNAPYGGCLHAAGISSTAQAERAPSQGLFQRDNVLVRGATTHCAGAQRVLPSVIGKPVKKNMATEQTTALIDLRPPPLRSGSARRLLVAEAAATGPHDDRAVRVRPGKAASRALLIGTGVRECDARQVLGVAPGAGERDSPDRGRKQDASPLDKG